MMVFGSAVGSWTRSDQNVWFRLMVGECPFSITASYLLLEILNILPRDRDTVLYQISVPSTGMWLVSATQAQEPPSTEAAEVEDVQQGALLFTPGNSR